MAAMWRKHKSEGCDTHIAGVVSRWGAPSRRRSLSTCAPRDGVPTDICPESVGALFSHRRSGDSVATSRRRAGTTCVCVPNSELRLGLERRSAELSLPVSRLVLACPYHLPTAHLVPLGCLFFVLLPRCLSSLLLLRPRTAEEPASAPFSSLWFFSLSPASPPIARLVQNSEAYTLPLHSTQHTHNPSSVPSPFVLLLAAVCSSFAFFLSSVSVLDPARPRRYSTAR